MSSWFPDLKEVSMNYGPVVYIVALFKEEHGAETVLKKIQDEHLEKELGLHELAIIQKDQSGKLTVKEPADSGGGKGAAIGGVVGALVGVVLGPAVVATTAAGALVGGLADKLYDTGFDNKDLKALAKALTPGTSALLVSVDDTQVARLKEMLAANHADVIADALNPEVAESLNAEYAGFIEKLKERGVDGLTVKDWVMVDDEIHEAKLKNSNDLGLDYIMPLVDTSG
jgi:uncharacterized membrane protein